MKRTAFTLVELLVVIAIIALLLAIMLPAMHTGRALARQAVCAANLHHISQGFVSHKSQQQVVGVRVPWFPEGRHWPGVPLEAVENVGVFICPEAVGKITGSYDLDSMFYLCRNRGLEVCIGNIEGLGQMWVGTRRGSDGRGEYLEIGLDDNEIVTASYMDRDGHDGIIRIYDQLPGGEVIAKLCKYSCGEINCVMYFGQPLFPDEAYASPSSSHHGWLGPGTSKNGMEVQLVGNSSNYGINRQAEHFQHGQGKILVLDYDKRIADPDSSNTQEMLQEAARHLGSINVLFADGTIDPQGPTQIDPKLPGNDRIWRP